MPDHQSLEDAIAEARSMADGFARQHYPEADHIETMGTALGKFDSGETVIVVPVLVAWPVRVEVPPRVLRLDG
jgi:hypothetical protein